MLAKPSLLCAWLLNTLSMWFLWRRVAMTSLSIGLLFAVCLPSDLQDRKDKSELFRVSNSVIQRLILQHVANTPFFPHIGCVCECLSLKNTKGICHVLHSGWGERKNSKGKEDLSCGCLSYLKHIYFFSWVSIIQHVITKYLQHTKHSCGTVNTKEEKKKPLLWIPPKVWGAGEMILHKSNLKAGWEL